MKTENRSGSGDFAGVGQPPRVDYRGNRLQQNGDAAKMAEFSRIGVPVFLSDVRGDLSGIGAGRTVRSCGAWRSASPTGSRRYTIIPWDIYGERATRSAPRFPISGRCCWGVCWI